MNRLFLCLLIALTYTTQEVTSGKWIIKEMANINYYPRKDFEFIEIHCKDFIIDPVKYGKFGWSTSLYNIKIMDIVNEGSIFPGEKHIDSSSVSWTFEEAFYIQINFDYVYNLGILPVSGKGVVYLHCHKAKYTMNVGDQEIIPTMECGVWEYRDLAILNGTSMGKMNQHIMESFNQDIQIQTMFYATFKRVMTKYYTFDYREKAGSIQFPGVKTNIQVDFQWVNAHTNIKDSTLEFDYMMVMTPKPLTPRLSQSGELTLPKDGPSEYSRMYFVDKQLILDVANVILPKVVNMPIMHNAVPKDSYWQLELWNLQKVLPDLLMAYPMKEQDDFHLLVNYVPSKSNLVLKPVRKFSDHPYYRLSGLYFDIDFIKEGEDLDLLLKVGASLYVDLYAVVEEDPKTRMVTMKFTAVNGDMTAEVIKDDNKGGFTFRRGLDEFLDEGFNDFLCRQLGHKAFGSGLQFEDYAHRGGVTYSEPTDDGVYIYLD